MLEQQLVDYIKKAKDAGQTDSQTRNLLYKNGWTVAEVDDAFTALSQPKPQIQAQPQTTAQPISVSQQKPELQPQAAQIKPRSHLLSKIIVTLMIIIVLGGALFAAGQYINAPWNPLRPKPETVINNMLKNMKDVKSYHTVVQFSVEATDNNSKASQGKLAFDTNNEIDITNLSNPKANGNFTVNLTAPGLLSSAVSLSANIVAVGNALYFKINNLVIPDQILDFSKIKGNWFKFDQDSVKALSQAESKQIGQANISLDMSQGDSSGITKKIQDLISSENIFTINKQLNDEIINSQDTYHYLITVSKEKLKDLVNKILAAGNLTMIQSVANNLIDTIGDINIEIWVGKKDYMLYKYSADKIIDLSKIFGIATSLEIKVVDNNSNFNKPIVAQVPQNAQKIEDVVLPLLKLQTIKSDLSQIGPIGQLLFSTNKNYGSLCSNGLLNGYLKTYGSDLISLNNNIVSQGAKKPVCFAGLQGYCVSTQLADNSYLCIDEAGIIGTTKCIVSQTVCK